MRVDVAKAVDTANEALDAMVRLFGSDVISDAPPRKCEIYENIGSGGVR
jgi:hypothetical protein